MMLLLLMHAAGVRIFWNPVAAQDCTQKTINTCAASLNSGDRFNSVILSSSEDVVRVSCRRYQLFAACMKTVTPYCVYKTRLFYQGLDAAYDFLCNSGLDDYIQHQPCFADSHVQSEAKFCNETLNEKLESLSRYTDATYQNARLCQYADFYLDCVSNVLKSFCGSNAAAWMRTFDTVALCPYLSARQCPGWKAQCNELIGTTTTAAPSGLDVPWAVTLLSVSVALTLIIIVTAMIILICLRCRTLKRRQRRRSSDPGMPPPYPGSLATPDVTTISEVVAEGACGVSRQETSEKEDACKKEEGHFVPEAGDLDDDDELIQLQVTPVPPPYLCRPFKMERETSRSSAESTRPKVLTTPPMVPQSQSSYSSSLSSTTVPKVSPFPWRTESPVFGRAVSRSTEGSETTSGAAADTISSSLFYTSSASSSMVSNSPFVSYDTEVTDIDYY